MLEDKRKQARQEFLAKLKCFKGDIGLLQATPRNKTELEKLTRDVIDEIPSLKDRKEEVIAWFLEQPDAKAMNTDGVYSHDAYLAVSGRGDR